LQDTHCQFLLPVNSYPDLEIVPEIHNKKTMCGIDHIAIAPPALP
jgi:hypothetical protein